MFACKTAERKHRINLGSQRYVQLKCNLNNRRAKPTLHSSDPPPILPAMGTVERWQVYPLQAEWPPPQATCSPMHKGVLLQ